MTLKEEQIFISRVNSFVQNLVRNGNGAYCKHCTSTLGFIILIGEEFII